MFEEIVDDGRPQKLTMSTLCSGELKSDFMLYFTFATKKIKYISKYNK